jgi:hypothetical protein
MKRKLLDEKEKLVGEKQEFSTKKKTYWRTETFLMKRKTCRRDWHWSERMSRLNILIEFQFSLRKLLFGFDFHSLLGYNSIIVLLFIQWKYAYKVHSTWCYIHDILILSKCNLVFKVFWLTGCTVKETNY